MSKKSEEKKMSVDKFFDKVMLPRGLDCGEQIAKIIKELHPDAAAVLPLYRSAIAVIPKQDKDGNKSIEIWGYGDPHVNGDDYITKENVKPFHSIVVIGGDRYGPKYYDKFFDEFKELLTEDHWKRREETKVIYKKLEEQKK